MDRRTHPTFRTAVVELLVAVCMFSASSATAFENTLSVAGREEVEEVTARFHANLRSALEAGEAARRKWPKLVWQGLQCYEPTPVAHTLERMKSDLQEATAAEPRLGALQSYVDARLETIGRMPPTLIITERSDSPGPVSRLFGVRADQAEQSWRELRDFAQTFLAGQSLVTNLTVTSEPSGANVALRVVSSAIVRQISVATNAEIRNLWLGRYRLSAEKLGHKPAGLDVELVGQRNFAVSCTLARARSAEKSRCVQE